MTRRGKTLPQYDQSLSKYCVVSDIVKLLFPDVIICVADGWATDDLIYKWKDVDPVQIVPGLHLPR